MGSTFPDTSYSRHNSHIPLISAVPNYIETLWGPTSVRMWPFGKAPKTKRHLDCVGGIDDEYFIRNGFALYWVASTPFLLQVALNDKLHDECRCM